MEAQGKAKVIDPSETTAAASKIRARTEAITVESSHMPPEDFLSYGDIEDLYLFGETSQDREVHTTPPPPPSYCSPSPSSA